jgi:hypothetical protein
MGSLNMNWGLTTWDGHEKIPAIQKLPVNLLAADGAL